VRDRAVARTRVIPTARFALQQGHQVGERARRHARVHHHHMRHAAQQRNRCEVAQRVVGRVRKEAGRDRVVARQLPRDWRTRYGYEPVLLETFVESPRHCGTCYKAANWQPIGTTTGRGKKSTSHDATLPAKRIWLYPLRRDYRAALCG
jgi:Domain of unknown function (DUF4338)